MGIGGGRRWRREVVGGGRPWVEEGGHGWDEGGRGWRREAVGFGEGGGCRGRREAVGGRREAVRGVKCTGGRGGAVHPNDQIGYEHRSRKKTSHAQIRPKMEFEMHTSQVPFQNGAQNVFGPDAFESILK